MKPTVCATLLTALVAVFATIAHARDTVPLRLAQVISLPKVAGRIDHLAIDLPGQRLFIAALGNNTVEVVDLRAGARTQGVGGLREPQGVAFVPDLNKLFVANGAGGALSIFDGTSFTLLSLVQFSDDADNLRYDAETRRLYVGYGDGAVGSVDAVTGALIGHTKLPGHPESFQLETEGHRGFVNVPAANQIAVIDTERRTEIAAWPLANARANFPMALDEADHRLFVGFRHPAQLIVFDTESGKPVARIDIGGDTDDVFYDAARRRIYASCGDGFLFAFAQRDRDNYARLAKLPTASGARTSLFVAQLNRLYLAVPARAGRLAEIRVYDVQQ